MESGDFQAWVEAVLSRTPFAAGIASATPLLAGDAPAHRVFAITLAGRRFVVKVRDRSEAHLLSSLSVVRSAIDTQGFLNPIVQVLERDGWIVVITPYVAGDPIHPRFRHELPELFRTLARFNVENRSSGPFTSMYLDAKRFDSVDALISAEVASHLAAFGYGPIADHIVDTLCPLRSSLQCIVCEDTNLGNFVRTPEGRFVMVDTEWTHAGIAAYQFDHFDYFQFEEPAWYRIVAEARDCYRGYFTELGLPDTAAESMIRAIEALSVLRSVTYAMFHDNEPEACRLAKRLDRVLSYDRF